MKVAVVSEISAVEKNPNLLSALQDRGLEILNLGNTPENADKPLQYNHTGLMAGLILHLKIADFVVGGCGTGIGFMNAALQYPGVMCGHIFSPLDAWLYARINAGNCVSIALLQGYGMAGDVNLKKIFDELFTKETGTGYPPHRVEPQAASRKLFYEISRVTHRTFPEILRDLPEEFSKPVFTFPAFRPALLQALSEHPELASYVK